MSRIFLSFDCFALIFLGYGNELNHFVAVEFQIAVMEITYLIS